MLFSAWYKASQAMFTIAAFLLFTGFVLGFLYIILERLRRSFMMIAIITVLALSGKPGNLKF